MPRRLAMAADDSMNTPGGAESSSRTGFLRKQGEAWNFAGRSGRCGMGTRRKAQPRLLVVHVLQLLWLVSIAMATCCGLDKFSSPGLRWIVSFGFWYAYFEVVRYNTCIRRCRQLLLYVVTASYHNCCCVRTAVSYSAGTHR